MQSLDTYFEELPHVNNDPKLSNNNLLRENKAPAQADIRKDNNEVFDSFCVAVCTSEYLPITLSFHVIQSRDSNQISSLLRSNYKFSLYIRAEASNKKTNSAASCTCEQTKELV